MIAHCTEHPGLQICKGHVVGKAANVDLSVMVTVRIAANDKHMFSTVASHVGQPHGLVVEYKVRDCPGHPEKLAPNPRLGNPLEVAPWCQGTQQGRPPQRSRLPSGCIRTRSVSTALQHEGGAFSSVANCRNKRYFGTKVPFNS
jgi:hypothetical protein